MSRKSPYQSLARIYDPLFFALGKNYEVESKKILELIHQYQASNGNTLLDLACGTGEHIKYLKPHFNIIGVDVCSEMLQLAQQKNPDVSFRQMNMLGLSIDQKFDSIICLFSAIGYMVTKKNLNRAFHNISHHLKEGGIVIVEPWYSPEEIDEFCNLTEFGERDGISACRMRETKIIGKTATNKAHILVSQNGSVEHLVSHHTFGLFSKQDFVESFTNNGIQMCSGEFDLTGRGLYLGIKEEV